MTDKRAKFVRIPDVTGVKSTTKALLIRTDDRKEHWIPYSQISEHSNVMTEGDVGEIEITEWIAKQKELDYNEV